MDKPRGIIVFGPNGSGKTTLGRELARQLGYSHMDIEAYHFEESEIPYTVARSREDCLKLMLEDIEKHRRFVLTAVTGDFGEDIEQYYQVAVYVDAPQELRVRRVRQRGQELHGERVLQGGDMYEQQRKFVDFVAARSMAFIEEWAQTLACPILRVDGALDLRENAARIAEWIYQREV